MKAITERSFIGLHLATLATLATIISLPLLAISIAHAETNLNLSSGLSYINQQNLQSNQVNAIDGTSTTDRSGWQVAIGGGWQQINPKGGYAINAQTSLDQGFNGAGDIRSATFGGHWMHALSTNWLVRINAQISDYQDDDQPAYNNQAAGTGLTLGWFGPQNSGLDLTTDWQTEQYDDDPNQAYEADRYTVGSRYYFTHQRDSAYWSVGIAAGRFDAEQMPGYSYDTTRLTLAYNAWRWKKLQGNLQLQWRNNRFDSIRNETTAMSSASMGGGMSGTPLPMSSPQTTSQSAAQNDTYLTSTLSLSHPLGELWHISANLNAGQYRSNLADDRPLISAYLGVSVSY